MKNEDPSMKPAGKSTFEQYHDNGTNVKAAALSQQKQNANAANARGHAIPTTVQPAHANPNNPSRANAFAAYRTAGGSDKTKPECIATITFPV